MNLKKLLIVGILLSSNLFGSFFGLSYAPKTKDLVVQDRRWEGKAMGGIKYGGENSFYIDYKGGGGSKDNTITQYHYEILNIGITHSVNNITLMGGIGIVRNIRFSWG